VLGLLGWPGAALAQSEGFALNHFAPAERGSDWFWGESLDLRGHGRWAAGLVGDWAYKPLIAYDAQGEEVAALVKHQVYAHLGGTVTLFDRLRFGLNVPVLLYQTGESITTSSGTLTAPTGAALGDLRLGADVRLWGKYGSPFTIAAGAQVHFPTGSKGDFTSDGKSQLAPRLAVAGDIGIFTYSAKTAINIRFQGEDFAGQPRGSEWTFGGSAGLRLVDKKLTVGPELWSSTVLSDNGDGFFEKSGTPIEGIFGAHYQFDMGLRIGAGAGAGLSQGLGAPKVRTLLSIEWSPAPPSDPVHQALVIDSDGDKISDLHDACPNEPGLASTDSSRNGCSPSDLDGDGVTDIEDACPKLVGIRSEEPAKSGCPLPKDTDNDGIRDEDDACPKEAGVADSEHPQKNGCALRDQDGDSIVDEQDACVELVGAPNRLPEQNGCPQAVISDGQVKIPDGIQFETGTASIRPESAPVLEAVLLILNEHPEIQALRIEGHTDNNGKPWFNKKLSTERAQSVLAWLTARGCDEQRLSALGLGQDRPLDDNTTELGRQKNRRVEFHIGPAQDASTSASVTHKVVQP
jgi:OmpA-OmpF porin, OOP family